MVDINTITNPTQDELLRSVFNNPNYAGFVNRALSPVPTQVPDFSNPAFQGMFDSYSQMYNPQRDQLLELLGSRGQASSQVGGISGAGAAGLGQLEGDIGRNSFAQMSPFMQNYYTQQHQANLAPGQQLPSLFGQLNQATPTTTVTPETPGIEEIIPGILAGGVIGGIGSGIGSGIGGLIGTGIENLFPGTPPPVVPPPGAPPPGAPPPINPTSLLGAGANAATLDTAFGGGATYGLGVAGPGGLAANTGAAGATYGLGVQGPGGLAANTGAGSVQYGLGVQGPGSVPTPTFTPSTATTVAPTAGADPTQQGWGGAGAAAMGILMATESGALGDWIGFSHSGRGMSMDELHQYFRNYEQGQNPMNFSTEKMEETRKYLVHGTTPPGGKRYEPATQAEKDFLAGGKLDDLLAWQKTTEGKVANLMKARLYLANLSPELKQGQGAG